MSRSTQATFPQSSHDFVRALKAVSDPPVSGGPLKIEIAEDAYANDSFYVPNKPEVISEWILAKFLKERERETPQNPLFDQRYWSLLLKLSQPRASDAGPSSVKSWLTPLLHRIPFGPVLASFLKAFDTTSDNESESLAALATSCFCTIWPISAQRMNTEVLQDCFGSFLQHIMSNKSDVGTSQIGRMISTSYRNSLANSSNKKKLYQSFLQTHFQTWLQTLSKTTASKPDLKSGLLEAGLDTLFSLDVLRQNRDARSDDNLMERLQSVVTTDRNVVYEFLPVIVTSYIHGLSRHRGALFSQGSLLPGAAQDELHKSSMKFLVSALALVDDDQQDIRSWQVRLQLLRIVDQENIFIPDSVATLNYILEHILIALDDSWQGMFFCLEVQTVSHLNLAEGYLGRTALVIQCLSSIARIDYDLMSVVMSRILPGILQIPVSDEVHFEFLELIVIYHTKTRTMNALLEKLFQAISSSGTVQREARQRYLTSFSSPLMHDAYLDRLSRALINFMTESQCIPTTRYIFDVLKNTWEGAYGASHRGKSKRKEIADADEQQLATTYCLTARLASAVLSSLPVHSLSSATLEVARASLVEFRLDVVHYAISKSIRAMKKQGGSDSWSMEVCLAAHLRLLYALNVSRRLALPPIADSKTHSRLAELLSDEDVLPELVLEMFRISLYNLCVESFSNHQETIELLLVYLEKNFVPSDIRWTGQSSHLTRGDPGRAESALAIMYMVMERWLPEINRLSSPDQLKRLLKILVTINTNLEPPKRSMEPEQLLLQILHSAEFWEFSNIRSAFLALLDENTVSFDPATPERPKMSKLITKAKIYHFLLVFPMEYFSWQNMSDLTKRALFADQEIAQASRALDKDASEALIALRIFLKRVYVHTGAVVHEASEDQAKILIHILREFSSIASVSRQPLTAATLELAEVYFMRLLKTCKRDGPEATLQVLKIFNPRSFDTQTLASSCFVVVVDVLCKEFTVNSLHEDISNALRTIHGELSSSILPLVTSITHVNLSQGNLLQHADADLVSRWHNLLRLDQWLGPTESSSKSVPLIAQSLISHLAPVLKSRALVDHGALDNLVVNTFAILLLELDLRPEAQHSEHLDVIVAFYIYLCDTMPSKACELMDLHLGGVAKTLKLTDYMHLLTFVADSMLDASQEVTMNLSHLVHLARILLREHPSHSLIHVQKFTTRCLGIFTANAIFVDGPLDVRLQVLGMIAQHCSDQQAALRASDASSIWLLLSKFLAPSQEHDTDTSTAVFHKITSVLTSLIRLRRDLVTLSLPHLGLILRQLLLSTRGCRPLLGAKQAAMVINTQPRWISATHSLGAEEAKALGRLLESLNTKTTIRIPNSSSSDTQKAESLTKPFSKHASYVLKAYVEAMNDPLCILPLEVRKELQPGLFALCGMMNEHSRDALMISALDAGGKATLKALWKEYEKQRYVGRG